MSSEPVAYLGLSHRRLALSQAGVPSGKSGKTGPSTPSASKSFRQPRIRQSQSSTGNSSSSIVAM